MGGGIIIYVPCCGFLAFDLYIRLLCKYLKFLQGITQLTAKEKEMKAFTKLITTILVLVLSCASFLGCGGGSDNSDVTGDTGNGGGNEHTHSYSERVVEPTCTEDGYTVFSCSCGDEYTGNTVAKLGHNFSDGVCSRCNAPDPDYVAPVSEATWETQLSLNGLKNFTITGKNDEDEDFTVKITEDKYYGNNTKYNDDEQYYEFVQGKAFEYSGAEGMIKHYREKFNTLEWFIKYFKDNYLTDFIALATKFDKFNFNNGTYSMKDSASGITYEIKLSQEKIILAQAKKNGAVKVAISNVGETKITLPETVSHYHQFSSFGTYKGGRCELCGATRGLEYTLSADGEYYIVSGPGNSSATYNDYTIIPEYWEDKPVKEIDASAFSLKTCGDEGFSLPNTIEKIGERAFYKSKLDFIIIPEGVLEIGEQAFYNTELKNLFIPDSVTEIGAHAFEYNPALTQVTLGKGITKINDSLFTDCRKLNTLKYTGTMEQFAGLSFGDLHNWLNGTLVTEIICSDGTSSNL